MVDKSPTSAGIILFANETGNLLLGKRAEGSGVGTWSIQGGRLKDGEEPLEGAKREFVEETGLDIPIFNIKLVNKKPDFYTYIGFTPNEGRPDPDDEWASEHSDFVWVNPKDLTNYNLYHKFQDTLNSVDLSKFHEQSQKNRRLDEKIEEYANDMGLSSTDNKPIRKKEIGDKFQYFFNDESYGKLKKFLEKSPYNTDIEDSVFIYRIEEGKPMIESEEDFNKEISDLDRRTRSGDIDDPLHKFAEDPKNFEGNGWVVEVPKSVLEQIQEMVIDFKEVNPDKYKEAKNWYRNLNKLTEELSDNKSEQILFGLLLAIGSINTPFLVNFYEAAVMFSAIKHDMEQGNSDLLLQYLDEPWKQKFALKKYKKNLKRYREKERQEYYEKARENRENLKKNNEKGYNQLAVYYSLNYGMLSPLRAKTSGKLYNIIELIIEKGEDIDEQDVVYKMEEFLDYKTQDIRDLKPGSNEFLRGMKVANFALNIIEPDLAQDRLYELNATIDTWMVKAFWPGISYGKISSDPFAYSYLASQTAKLARDMDLLTQEMQAIIWTAMIDSDKPDALSTSSAISNGIEKVLDYYEVIDEVSEESGNLYKSIKQLLGQFEDLSDFKVSHSMDMKSSFTSMALSNKPLERFDEETLNEAQKIRDYKKFSSLVCNAYEARDKNEKESHSNYKAFVRANDKLFKNIQKRYKVRFLDNYDEIGYFNADNMRDRIDDTGVFLIDKNIKRSHPVLDKNHLLKFRTVKKYIMHVLFEKGFGDYKNMMQSYKYYSSLVSEKAKPALFTEFVGDMSCRISGGSFGSKACLLDGFNYNNLGQVDEHNYQMNFEGDEDEE